METTKVTRILELVFVKILLSPYSPVFELFIESFRQKINPKENRNVPEISIFFLQGLKYSD